MNHLTLLGHRERLCLNLIYFGKQKRCMTSCRSTRSPSNAARYVKNSTLAHGQSLLLSKSGNKKYRYSSTQHILSAVSSPPPATIPTNESSKKQDSDRVDEPLLQTVSPTDSTTNREDVQPARSRLQCYRDDAREAYQDFRDHPGASAKAGAKSVGDMIRSYGPIFILTYGSVYLTTLGSLWAGVESGVLDPASLFNMLGHGDESTASTVKLVLDFMNNHTITQPYSHFVEKYPSVANFAVAWIAVKFTEPIRLPTALYLTPRVARILGFGPKTTVTEKATLASTDESSTSSKEVASTAVQNEK
jgi:Protein of unknown function (DUF1279)